MALECGAGCCCLGGVSGLCFTRLSDILQCLCDRSRRPAVNEAPQLPVGAAVPKPATGASLAALSESISPSAGDGDPGNQLDWNTEFSADPDQAHHSQYWHY